MKRVILCVLAALLFFSATACGREPRFWAGEPMTAEELEKIKAGLENKETPKEEEPPHDGTFYWLKSGKVYHYKSTCYHIKDKENVQSGTKEEAEAAGKTKACAHCSPSD